MAFFDGGSRAPALTWKDRETLGKPRGGRIVAIDGLDEPVYARVFGSNEIKTWGKPTPENPNPRPVEQIIITVQTDEKNPENPLDDGQRTVYIEKESLKFSKNYAIVAKRGQPKTGTPYAALLDALEKAGTPKEIKVGGTYLVAWIGEEESPADSPRKIYAAKYIPPVAGIFSDDNGSASAQTSNPFQQQESAQPTKTPAAVAPNPFAELASAFGQQPASEPVDPLAVAREAVKLEIIDAPDKATLAAIYDRAVNTHGVGFWTAELQSLAETRIAQLANPPVRQPVAAANPFA